MSRWREKPSSGSLTRRGAFASFLAGGSALAASPSDAAEPAAAQTPWRRGVEGQRRADLGDGRYLNPILAGDHPDPSILKDGGDYYICFSSFDAYPGVAIWRSRDLVNWTPVTTALTQNIGSVWAPELVKHEGRYFIYIPARFPDRRGIYVVTAQHIEGPWSAPVDLKLPNHIDPGHAVDETGRRWLFLSGGDRIALSDDGLRTVGAVEHVYDPWRPPSDWVIEGFSPEGPKITRHGGWYYLITAVGGTAGPPTGHMVIAARSRSLAGPWENCPANPLVRTTSARQAWWSRGHATLVEGPAGDWWAVYHGYENGFWTLGRQTLLDPIEWTADGWFRFKGGDLAGPLRKPAGGKAASHGRAISDDFSSDAMGQGWTFYAPGRDEAQRVTRLGDGLTVKAKGTSPADGSPLTTLVGDKAYEVQVSIEIDDGAQAGLLLFYNRRLYCGLAFNGERLVMHRQGLDRDAARLTKGQRRLWIRATNDHHIVTFHTSGDGQAWTKFDVQMEVSGYHHNTAYDFLSLRPGLYVAGQGSARFRDFRFRALTTEGGEHGA